jgi:hypothetical protein
MLASRYSETNTQGVYTTFRREEEMKPPLFRQNNFKRYKQIATVLFPCGVGLVASHLLSKLVGLYHKVIYVGGP